jgi:hypothetical protein
MIQTRARSLRVLALAVACSLSIAASGCEGQATVTGEFGETGGSPAPSTPGSNNVSAVEGTIPPQPLRRISSRQYHNVIGDLFPASIAAELQDRSTFPATRIETGFANAASANVVNRGESNAIEDNAETLANYLLDNADTTVPAIVDCVDSGYTDEALDACMPEFIRDFGALAYRRPLTGSEEMILQHVYDTVRATQSASAAWASVMQVFLQAPALLYRTELSSTATDPDAELTPLSDWEMASRLSFLFLNSMPDAELRAAAEAGELHSPEQIEAHARRLANSPEVLDSLTAFHRDWAKLFQLDEALRADEAFTEDVRAAMQQETRQLLRHVYVDGDARLSTLLTTPSFPVAAELGPLYGIDDADGSVRTVPNRAGLLTQVSFNTAHAKERATDPVHRGYFTLKSLLCDKVGEIPEGLDLNGPLAETATAPTARQRLAPQMERNDCKGCHLQFNPMGYALENYDELGRWRVQENDVTIDASGELLSLQGATFDDAIGMVELLGNSQKVRECYVDNWYEYAMGRSIVTEERATLAPIKQRFEATDGDIRELLVAIATSRAFTHRPRPAASE